MFEILNFIFEYLKHNLYFHVIRQLLLLFSKRQSSLNPTHAKLIQMTLI